MLVRVAFQDKKNNAMGNADNHSHLLQKLTFLIGFCGGIGGILVDLDHILNAATGGLIPWALFHAPAVAMALICLCTGCFIALVGGLLGALVLNPGQKPEQSSPLI
ncbi:MAG: hypothetical protein ABH934_01075 [Chloroflexota bacterium]